MSKFLTISKFAKELSVSSQTIRNWEKEGKLIPHHKSSNGYRYYTQEQLDTCLGIEKKKKIIGYCRVSSLKQKDDLERQVENMQLYLSAKGQPYEIITDVGSGINYNNKGLQKLLKSVIAGEVSLIVVLYKDRLVRFGYELIEFIAEQYECDLEIIDSTEKTEEQELVEDLVQIITVFSCKLQGKRARIIRKMVEELISDD